MADLFTHLLASLSSIKETLKELGKLDAVEFVPEKPPFLIDYEGKRLEYPTDLSSDKVGELLRGFGIEDFDLMETLNQLIGMVNDGGLYPPDQLLGDLIHDLFFVFNTIPSVCPTGLHLLCSSFA